MPVSRPILDRCRDMIMPIPWSGCWVWTGVLNGGGYGVVSVANRARLAHRVIFELLRHRVPDGLELDHKCRVRSCVNPDHLEPVTRSENIRRGLAPGQLSALQTKLALERTHCPYGHPYSDDNLIVQKTGRVCRECKKRRQKAAFRLRQDKAGIPPGGIKKTHCIHGHEFTPENTAITIRGDRSCRQCSRDKSLRHYWSTR